MATFYFNGSVNNSWSTVATPAYGPIGFGDQPADGDTLTIGDTTFEFDNDSSINEGNTSVNIGNNLTATLSTLKASIESSSLNVTVTINETNLDLVRNIPGVSGYAMSAVSSVISAYNMTDGSSGNWWTDDTFTTQTSALPTSNDSVVAVASITSNGGDEPTVVNFTMDGSYIYLDTPITVTGTATFNGDSYNSSTITGTVLYNGLTGYVGGEDIYYIKGQLTSLNSSGDGNWNGLDYLGGVAEITLYYNSSVDTNWNNLNNWWSDSGVTTQATFLPRTIDSVIFLSGAQCLSNTGSEPNIKNLTLN